MEDILGFSSKNLLDQEKQLKAREVEVSYKPRTRLEGKSITMIDGIKIVYYMVSFRLFYRLFK